MMKKSGWRGYVTSRENGGNFVPQRVQNLVIRNYCEKNEKAFLLSPVEFYMDECFMMLNALLETEINSVEAIVFYSTHLLPQSREERMKLYQRMIEANCELRFALEEFVIKTWEDAEKMEDILLVRNLSSQVDLVI